jgi:DNA-binding NarL/FixJ family response regulator
MPLLDHSETPALPIEEDTLVKLRHLAESRGTSIGETLCHLVDAAAADHEQVGGAADLEALTPKQRAVLGHLKSGLSVKETATRMEVSEETIRTHILRARVRLDCPDLLALRYQ